jgi:hypothetical protein
MEAAEETAAVRAVAKLVEVGVGPNLGARVVGNEPINERGVAGVAE